MQIRKAAVLLLGADGTDRARGSSGKEMVPAGSQQCRIPRHPVTPFGTKSVRLPRLEMWVEQKGWQPTPQAELTESSGELSVSITTPEQSKRCSQCLPMSLKTSVILAY